MKNREKLIGLVVAGVLLAAVVIVIVVARGGDDDDPGTAATPVTKEGNLDEPGTVVKKGEPATVTMETSEGTFKIALDTERAPITANNFAYLTEEGFYDGLGFHRIVPDFVIQGGDPLGDGTGGPGYKVVEAPPKNLKYDVGVVAMAKSGAEASGTSGSQFYIVTGSGGQSLTPDYALVGKVSEGMDVVEKIGGLGGPDEQPTRDVVIEKATLEKG
ncbi:MAG TPA: peptidylprolyl isomerase [Solirubrobacterales bacterium]|nr:peptidylprolyl isomerase [Solirubrobacterales bacterium]